MRTGAQPLSHHAAPCECHQFISTLYIIIVLSGSVRNFVSIITIQGNAKPYDGTQCFQGGSYSVTWYNWIHSKSYPTYQWASEKQKVRQTITWHTMFRVPADWYLLLPQRTAESCNSQQFVDGTQEEWQPLGSSVLSPPSSSCWSSEHTYQAVLPSSLVLHPSPARLAVRNYHVPHRHPG